MKRTHGVALLILVGWISFAYAHETEEKSPYPGYRPESEYAKAFLDSVGQCQMVVYPTVIRIKTPDSVLLSQSTASQKTIFDRLIDKRIVDPNGLDMEKIEGRSQFDFFQYSLKQMSQQIKPPYHLAMEFILIQRPDNQLGAFGVHIYILDSAGNNAFSFLLNSHHQLFVDAKLFSNDNSQESIDKLASQCTQVALEALTQQIDLAMHPQDG